MRDESGASGGGLAAFLLAVFIAACTAALAVWWGGVNQDEGWYLYASKLVGEGKLPYRDFFFTQGPVLPFLYSVMPIRGLLSGRLVTLAFSVLATLVSMALARRLVSPERRGAAALTVFAMLACNIYHVYFTTIPKTYAIGSLFVVVGFLLLSRGWHFLSAVSFAFASGTRISLVLILGVVGVALLVTRFRELKWLWFGVGGVFGLFLVYGFFAIDQQSLRGLLAAQAYHAGRGGFDPFFAVGAVSRLARGYLALGAVLFAAAFLKRVHGEPLPVRHWGVAELESPSPMMWMMGLSFAAVFLLQMSAPFPYDDYEVPIMPLLAVLISVWYANRAPAVHGGVSHLWFPVFAAGMCAFASPQIQDWMTNGQDRFWSLKKEKSELAQMRDVARQLEALDPGGEMLFTQDLYLAVEMGRKVPEGLEMGPFSYFPAMSTADAEALHVMNGERLEALIDSAPCRLAAYSGYGFAIEVPKGTPTPVETRRMFGDRLLRKYSYKGKVDKFGQNHTMLQFFTRRDGADRAD